MKTKINLIAALLLFLIAAPAKAQNNGNDTTKVLYLVTKTDGAEYYGYIISDDGRELLLETLTIGKFYINKSEIKSIQKLENKDKLKIDGGTGYKDYRNEGPFTTRYYFTNNAHAIKNKENYALLHLYGPEIHMAVKDNLSLGIMTTWIGSPIALAGKYTFFDDDKNSIAAGTIIGSSGYLQQAKGYLGLHWLTYTRGNRMSNVSLSAGYGYADLYKMGSAGNKYVFTSDPSSKYYIPDYRAHNAVAAKLFGVEYGYDEKNSIYPGLNKAIIIGISGITPVGKKASFIMDAMILNGKRKTVKYSDYPITVSYTDYNGMPQTNTFIIGKGSLRFDGRFTNIVVMPAMRFTQSYNKAFQVALAGVIHIEDGGVNTFPLPMVSWLRQF